MDTVAYERWNETDGDNAGLFAREMLRHDVYSLPDEETLVFCPECGELAESFNSIEHRNWCFYGGHGIRPGNF
jgi:hypothetical protein